MSNEVMITTEDNPFSPFDQFEQWYTFDRKKGYHTPSLLARTTHTSSTLSIVDQERAIDLAIDEIVEMNVTGLYKKVKRSDYNVD